MTARTRTAALAVAALTTGALGVGLTAGLPGDRTVSRTAVPVAAVLQDEGRALHDEGPGTAAPPTGSSRTTPAEGDEGPGTTERPAPAYGSTAPASWRVVVPQASVYAVPGDLSTRTGSISDRTADVAGTGRTAVVGTADWYEVKVPGATTGWVVGTELERR